MGATGERAQEGRVHFVGIGGVGMSAIARVLLETGGAVSGSDRQWSPTLDALLALGAQVHQGHRAGHVGDARLVVVSSAVPQDNPEVAEARRRGIPVVKRAQLLGEMMASRLGVAVAGTHGKTTTSAMIAFILERAGRDPTALVGGELVDWGTNARAGRGEHLVAEADEFDESFLRLCPHVAVVTNVEYDHPDCYPSLEDVISAFQAFLALLPPDGWAALCGDDPLARGLGAPQGSILYGLGAGAGWRGADLSLLEGGAYAFHCLADGHSIGSFRLRVPGLHNVRNALAAICVTHRLGAPVEAIQEALAGFSGVRRRFQVKGTERGVTLVDDYAHHPTELSATLAAARQAYPGRPLWAVFQPHTYTRTRALLGEFSSALQAADHVIVTGIYAAREGDDLGLSGAEIVEGMDHRDARFVQGLREASAHLEDRVRAGDVVLTLGAGDVDVLGGDLLAALGKPARRPLTGEPS